MTAACLAHSLVVTAASCNESPYVTSAPGTSYVGATPGTGTGTGTASSTGSPYGNISCVGTIRETVYTTTLTTSLALGYTIAQPPSATIIDGDHTPGYNITPSTTTT